MYSHIVFYLQKDGIKGRNSQTIGGTCINITAADFMTEVNCWTPNFLRLAF
jgi:hypothetical protein